MRKIFVIVLLAISTIAKSQTKAIYVSPAGNNDNSGEINAPLANLQGAFNRMQNMGRFDYNKLEIVLEDGNYQSAPIVMKPAMNGAKGTNIIIKARNPKKVVLSNAKKIKATNWSNITDPLLLKRLQAHLKDSILELSLSSIGLDQIKEFPDIFDGNGDLPYLFMDGEWMPLSTYPNEGKMAMCKVLVNGGGQEKPGSWKEYYSNPEIQKKLEINPPRPGIFKYQDEHAEAHNRWANAIKLGFPVWLKGYWRVMWQNETVKIGQIDKVSQTVKLAVPVSGGIGSKYHRPGGSGQEMYYTLNLLEEIDHPGEWCIDFKTKKIFFYPQKDISTSTILVAFNNSPVLKLQHVSNVTLEGVVIEGSLGNGLEITGGNSNKVLGCDVRNVVGDGIKVNGGHNHEIKSNDIYNIGGGGIWLSGGMEDCTPRVAASHKVVNNYIHDFALVQKIYAAGINCGFTGGGSGGHHPAVGMYIAHNLIHTTPHVGMLFASFDNVFEYNEVCDWSRVSNDMGALYSYDYYPMIANTVVRYNFFHSSKEGDGIYFDNNLYNATIHGNILYHLGSKESGRGTPYLIKNYGFDPVYCTNNMVIDCKHGFHIRLNDSSIFENNIAIDVKEAPFFVVEKGKDEMVTSNFKLNKSYYGNPGFEDLENMKFNLNTHNEVQKIIPEFKAIPFDKIGLYIDEYRKTIPTKHRDPNYLKNIKLGDSYKILDRN